MYKGDICNALSSIFGALDTRVACLVESVRAMLQLRLPVKYHVVFTLETF